MIKKVMPDGITFFLVSAHIAFASVAPGVVGDECQTCVFGDKRGDGCAGNLCLTCLELRIGANLCFLDINGIVGMLDAVNQRTALNAQHTSVGFNILVGTDDTGLHIEVDFYHVAFLPLSTHRYISV